MLISGLLAKGLIKNNSSNKIYSLSNIATYMLTEIVFINTGSSSARVTMYVTDKSIPDNSDAIEFNTLIIAGGLLERTCVAVKAGESIFLSTDSTTVTYRLTGLDSATGLQTQWFGTYGNITLNVLRANTNKPLLATISYIKVDGSFTVDQNVNFGTTDSYGNLNFTYRPNLDSYTVKISVWVYSDGNPLSRASFTVDGTNNLSLI